MQCKSLDDRQTDDDDDDNDDTYTRFCEVIILYSQTDRENSPHELELLLLPIGIDLTGFSVTLIIHNTVFLNFARNTNAD